MLNGTGLPMHAAAGDQNDEVKLVEGLRSLQRLLHQHAVSFIEEVLLEGFVVDGEFPGSGSQKYSSR